MTRRLRFSPSVYRAILERQNWICACGCGEDLIAWPSGLIAANNLHFDHILPLHLGGKDEPENLQALLRGHHAQKTAKEAIARGKVRRIQAQDGLLRKKLSKRDRVTAKILGLEPTS